MARVNVDTLGISELKWTGMGEFNSDDHYIYYCRQESLRRSGVAIMVNKRHFHALEKEMATHSSVLAWRISWTEEHGGLQSMGLQESDTT